MRSLLIAAASLGFVALVAPVGQVGRFNAKRPIKRAPQLSVLRGLPSVSLMTAAIFFKVPRFDANEEKALEGELNSMIELELTRTRLKVKFLGPELNRQPISDPLLFVQVGNSNIFFDEAIVVELTLMERVKLTRNGHTTQLRVPVWSLEHEIACSSRTTVGEIKEAVRTLLTEFCLDWTKANRQQK